jgi:hypothetical protein
MNIDLKQYTKFAVALLGAAIVTANYALPLLPEKYKVPVTIALVFLTALGVYASPNAPALPKPAART